MEFSYNTTLKIRSLNIRKDQKNFIIENPKTNDFYEMPKICIDAIEMINQSIPLQEIEDRLKANYPDEEVDILDFSSQLLELGLVSEVDGEVIPCSEPTKSHHGFTWIPSRLGRFFFNKISSVLYLLLFASSIAMLIVKPELFPRYSDLFAFDLMLQNAGAWIVITTALVLLHEIGHVLAVRSENLPARIELGHRLFLVVLETDMSQVWKLPTEKRSRLYLAGMYFDMTILFLALTGQFFTNDASVMAGLLKIAVLDTFIRLAYQAAVFMKTDLYYVFENWAGCYNLMENGRNMLGKWLPFLKVSETEAFPGEEKVIRRYAVFYVAGIALTLTITAYYYIPQLLFAIKHFMLPGLTEPLHSIRFWDSAVLLLQMVVIMGLLLYSWSKKYRISS
jgi:putative peptide zinc metalloprotease protein